ncbi:MAG TPA: hypothetical protein VFS43_20905 [Polyangiaceae bacterium]|nr:hypothetical protein [Polyangiaceae bacterium]
MPRLSKGLLVALLAAIPVAAWAGPKIAQSCDPSSCPDGCPTAKAK